ncbi:MAG: alpha-E domain-containing protein [Pseudomonadota bacterium]|nr:alpha-E domain-containing protein [Pseudomonadota bacterium]
MLSRTADHMYWMSRYIERAESVARLVDAHYRMSLLPHTGETLADSLGETMKALHMDEAYKQKHSSIEPRAVFEFITLDRDFTGSIYSCLRCARENARAVRGSLTSELWETLNSTWLDARSQIVRRSASQIDIGQFVEWVKERSHLTRGVTIGTMMRDEAFHFTRIGTFLERADSTARILTAHQGDLVPGADAGVVPDPFQWSVLLRALSAFEVYRRVFRDVITPSRVAQLLILRDDMPRSLLRCCKELYSNLKSVANEQSAETERRAGEMHAMQHFARMEELNAGGLPQFLEQFLAKLDDLGHRISSDFLVPPAEA